ncbi:hypothetical protein BZB76_0264 [Actinomadura pelletieri DSM 43383]|uniref:Uncharacterized protein n=1 Tax=Actinomadura pelletieri DSM 43383 TaxID=1120940 RepID=A0A495QXI4_9ACTN|nr:hypothetical protein BZB76_0264 [Actinomadura pelletieri DSM 43383]
MTAPERNGRLLADPTIFPATSCFAQFLREDVTFLTPAWLVLTWQEVASAKVPEREAPGYACFVPFSDGAALPRHLIKEELEPAVRPRTIETVTQSSRSIGNSQVRVSVHSSIVPSPTSRAELAATRPNGDGGADVVPGQRHDGCANGAALSARGLSSPSECSCDRCDGMQTRRHLSRSLSRPLESPRPTRLLTGRGRFRHTRSIGTVRAAPPSRRCSPERQSAGHPGPAGFAEDFDRRLVPIRDTRPQRALEKARDASERPEGVLDHPRRHHKARVFDDLAFTLLCDRLRTWFPENT